MSRTKAVHQGHRKQHRKQTQEDGTMSNASMSRIIPLKRAGKFMRVTDSNTRISKRHQFENFDRMVDTRVADLNGFIEAVSDEMIDYGSTKTSRKLGKVSMGPSTKQLRAKLSYTKERIHRTEALIKLAEQGFYQADSVHESRNAKIRACELQSDLKRLMNRKTSDQSALDKILNQG
jgi:hypothetical protein